ncbi:MAG: malate synthase G, partial [Actinomycetota bacterium]
MVTIGSLEIADELHDFVRDTLLPGTDVSAETFWSGFAELLAELAPSNAELLTRRDEIQELIDQYLVEHRDDLDPDHYADFLREIGYLKYFADDVSVETDNVDPEIASVAGPQLVVPLDNARYALNAANARWGSLYDAYYGTDVIGDDDGAAKGKKYNPIRGEKVVEKCRDFLDHHFPLDRASHAWIVKYYVENGDLKTVSGDGTVSTLLRPDAFIAYSGDAAEPDSVLLRKHGLGVEIRFGEGFF